MLHVSLLAPFGPEPRGVSLYADGLLAGFQHVPDIEIDPLDFARIYPHWLVPTTMPEHRGDTSALVHYLKPATWRRCAEASAGILHIQYWTSVTAYYLAAIAERARRQGKIVIVTVHNPAPHESIKITASFERRLLHAASHAVVLADRGRVVLCRRFDLDESRVTVIPHGIAPRSITQEISDRAADCARLSLDPSLRYLVSFGNQRHYKGTDLLLDAWQRVRGRWPDTRLIIAGRTWGGDNVLSRQVAKALGSKHHTANLHRLLAKAHELQLELRLGFMSNDEIDAYCRVAMGGIFAYRRFSGQSGAATLAGGWGVPLIVSDVGALPDLAIEQELIVTPESIDDLARSIDYLLRQPHSEQLRARQRERCAVFSWPTVAAQHAELYLCLHGNRSA